MALRGSAEFCTIDLSIYFQRSTHLAVKPVGRINRCILLHVFIFFDLFLKLLIDYFSCKSGYKSGIN